MSNEDLVLAAGEWVGASAQQSIVLQAEDSNCLTGRGIKTISRGQIFSYAERYLALLAARSAANPSLLPLYQELRERFDKTAKKESLEDRDIRKSLIRTLAGLAVIVAFVSFMASGQSKSEDKEHVRLRALEAQVQSAIEQRDYEKALGLANQLIWTFDVQAHDGEVAQYNREREALIASIQRMMK